MFVKFVVLSYEIICVHIFCLNLKHLSEISSFFLKKLFRYIYYSKISSNNLYTYFLLFKYTLVKYRVLPQEIIHVLNLR